MTLTTAAQNLDPGHASFMAMLYLDYVYNSPITSVLAANLANAMRTRRIKNEMKQDDQRPETQVWLYYVLLGCTNILQGSVGTAAVLRCPVWLYGMLLDGVGTDEGVSGA
eukprot:2058150-Rhodomonas_salina.2